MKRSGGQRTIPKGWRLVRLGDVLELDQPGAWGEDPTPAEPGVRVLRAADLTRDGQVKPGNAAWRRLSERDLERRLMQEGDLILERSGGGPGTPVGRVALVQGLGSVYCNNFCQQLRVDGAKCTPKYAARTLWHRYTQGVTARLEHQTTGIRNLDYAAYLNLPVLLPPLPEQQAIAAVLDSIDDAIERTEAVIAATEQLRDSLLHQLLTRGVPGQHTEWRDVPGLGTIPADWDVVRLGDVAETITSGSRAWSQYFRPEGAFFVRSQNIIHGKIDRSDAIWVEPPLDGEAERTRIREGDLLISITGEPGKSAVVDQDLGRAFVSQHVALVRLRDPQLSCFAVRLLQGEAGREQFERMVYGQTRPGLNLSNVSAAKVALPTRLEQQAIVTLMDGVDATLSQERR